MTQYSKFNVIYLLQKWMDSVPGQTFLNYAYSWGASIVIAGTLFKLTHLPGANLMLFIGMGTEVLVFFLSAFDRPFDKTTDGMDLQRHVGQPNVVYEGDGTPGEDVFIEGEGPEGQIAAAVGAGGPTVVGGGGTVVGGGGTVVGGGGTVVGGGGTVVGGGGGTIIIGGVPVEGQPAEGQPVEVAGAEGEEAGGGLNVAAGAPAAAVNTAWLSQQQQVSPEMAEATENYVDELKRLTEMLGKVNEQSVRLTRDSEEMENLNRTLTGICKVYEMQLKGASQQIGTIDQINDQSKKLAQQIEQLNKIYARMIEAMTVNMRGSAPTGSAPTAPTQPGITL